MALLADSLLSRGCLLFDIPHSQRLSAGGARDLAGAASRALIGRAGSHFCTFGLPLGHPLRLVHLQAGRKARPLLGAPRPCTIFGEVARAKSRSLARALRG